MTVTIRAATGDSEVDAAYELAARTFGPSYFESAASHQRIRQLEPVHSLDDVIIAVDGNAIVGFVRIVDRTLCLGEVRLPTGGITSVSVHPQYQGKGYGRAMMEHAIERQGNRGDVWSVAFARRAVDGFYAPLGYLGIGSHPEMRTATTRGSRSSGDDSGFRLDSIDVYSEAYDQSYLTLPFQFARDSSWWEQLPERMSHRTPDASFRTIRANGKVAGYAIVKDNVVLECASRKEAQSDVLDELRQSATGDELLLRLPTGHWAMRASRHWNHTIAVRHSWDGGHVARIIDGGALCAALARWGVTAQQLHPILRANLRDHRQALRALEALVGARADLPSDPLVATPAWSALDEF